jgi:AcrR family transcriptional regulator
MRASTEPLLIEDSELRQRILSAAFQTFMEHGYAGASTLDIARRARVSKRDLYAHFGSKQAMLAACIAARAERMRGPLHLPVPRDEAALANTLVSFGTTLLREASRPEVLAVQRLACTEAEHSPEVARTLDDLGRASTRKALAEMLTAAQSSGLLGPGNTGELADDFTAILWRGGLLMRLLLRVAAPPSAKECERRARAATVALLRLYPPG